MIGPITHAAAQVIVSVRWNRDVEMRSDITRFTDWAFFGLISTCSLQNLYEMANYCLTGMNCNRGGGSVRISVVCQPPNQLPCLLCRIFQMLPQFLIATASTKMIHKHLCPSNEVCGLRLLDFFRQLRPPLHCSYQ